MKEILVDKNEAGQRLDKLLIKLLNQAPSSFIYKMLRKKNIKLNQKKADGKEILKSGDTVQIFLSDETYDKFHADKEYVYNKDGANSQRELKKEAVIYEDPDIIIINKPTGVLTQKADAGDDSLNERMLRYLLSKGEITTQQLQTFTPSVCNRLDRNTSGLVLAGKSLKGSQELSRLLKERLIHKYYLALVNGHVKNAMKINAYLVKDEKNNCVTIYNEQPDKHIKADYIETEYRPLYSNEQYTLLEVKLITGKTHQIRAHLAHIGYPIVGDGKYGDSNLNRIFREKYKIQNQCLHAWRVEFPKNVSELAADGCSYAAPLFRKENDLYNQLFHVDINRKYSKEYENGNLE